MHDDPNHDDPSHDDPNHDRNNHMHDDLDTRLQRHLDDQATVIALRDTPIQSVVQRGNQRRQRRTTGIGLFATAAIVTTAVVGIQVLSRNEHPHRIVNGNGNGNGNGDLVDVGADGNPDTAAPQPATDRIVPVASNIAWTLVQPDETSALAYAYLPYSGQQTGAPFLAYATQPGAGDNGVQTLYESKDGISWTPVDSGSLRIDGRAAASDGQRLYSITTAAATAEDPTSPNGNVTISSSADGGGSWSDTVLTSDLDDLMQLSGVQDVSPGPMQVAAGPRGVVVTMRTEIQFDLGDMPANGAITISPDGVTVSPYPCETTLTTGPGVAVETTAIMNATETANASDTAAVADTAPAAPNEFAGGDAPATTSIIVDATTVGSVAPCDTGATTTMPATDGSAEHITWAELGVDPSAVDAEFAPPRMFFSPDGAEYREITFPAPAVDGARTVAPQLFAYAGGFAMVAADSTYDGSSMAYRLFVSSDGTTWTERSIPWAPNQGYITKVGQLEDGTLVMLADVSGSAPSRASSVAVSTDDGVTWTVTNMNRLLNADDGTSAQLQGYTSDIGPLGITVVGNISTDPYVEEGPSTITFDGVVVSQVDQYGTMDFTDEATGEQLGHIASDMSTTVPSENATVQGSFNAVRDNQTGDITLSAADGSVRLLLTPGELAPLYQQVFRNSNRVTVLHSDDGVTWSRDDMDDVAGFSAAGYNSFIATPTQLLVTITSSEQMNSMGKPTTYVLVGTPKT